MTKKAALPKLLSLTDSGAVAREDGALLPAMRNLQFNLFDDSGVSRAGRILMFYSFDTEERLARSGILHYNVEERRFMGPRHDEQLTSAALQFLVGCGRLQSGF